MAEHMRGMYEIEYYTYLNGEGICNYCGETCESFYFVEQGTDYYCNCEGAILEKNARDANEELERFKQKNRKKLENNECLVKLTQLKQEFGETFLQRLRGDLINDLLKKEDSSCQKPPF